MKILTNVGDGIKAERIICIFRKMTRPILVSRTHKHRAQQIKIFGLPAEAYISKPFRFIK